MGENLATLTKHINQYIEKCIRDACTAESRVYDETKSNFFYIIVENPDKKSPMRKEIYICIHTPYQRVTRKTWWRVKNNLEKNFGIRMGDYYRLEDGDCLQVNFVCNKIQVKIGTKTKYYYINNYNQENEIVDGKVIGSRKYEKLCMTYHNVNYDEYTEETHDNYRLPYDIDWESYKSLYEKTFERTCNIKILCFGGSKNIEISEV